jgi:hypothetical protein
MMKRTTLIFSLLVIALWAGRSDAYDFLTPIDPIIPIDVDPPVSASATPNANENVLKAIDGIITGSKYLNTAGSWSGFITSPGGSTTIQSFRLATANDAVTRDPTSYELWGTNSAIASADHSTGLGEPWSFISGGPLSLPATRNFFAPAVSFTNAAAYTSYKFYFPTVNGSNLMQIADVSFYDGTNGTGTDILDAGDFIIAIDAGYQSNAPANEGANRVLDLANDSKYLNFGENNSGFIVTPTYGSTIVNGFKITTANDHPERDPASWALYGTNDAIVSRPHSDGVGENWTLIDQGTFTLPDDRFALMEVPVTNALSAAYTSYRMVFPTVRDATTANSMQVAEVALSVADDAKLQINRQTGIGIINATATTTFKSYQVTSPGSALDDTNWTSIASTNADPDDTWSETSPPGSKIVLSEEDGASGANNGFTITAGNNYSLGDIWPILPTAFEDVLFAATRLDGLPAAVGIEFVGTEIPIGDYSGNGTVGPEDWPAFRAGYGGDYTGDTLVDAYLGGDLDGDFDSDLDDFNLFVDAAGGMGALFGEGVPEPSSIILLFCAVIGGIGVCRLRRPVGGAAAIVIVGLITAPAANAQTYTNVGNVPVGITIPAGQMNETAMSGPEHLFDDTFLDDPAPALNDELFVLDYNDPMLNCPNCLQYAGLNAQPKTVFFDYGSPVTANWFAYAQRSGADPTADRVGKFEFWFSNTDFAGVLPATPADAVVSLLPTDARLRDSVLRPYSLSGDHTGQYVAVRLTVSALSAGQPTNNIGGHEFRLMDGPGDVILQVDRNNGALTLMNNLADAQAIEMKSYKIESPLGGLDPLGFNGLRGDTLDFPLGSGSGDGWEIGGGSNTKRLVEGYFSGVSTLPTGTAGLSLGNAYNEFSLAEDLLFTWTNAAGELYDARVVYVGTTPVTPGDYNLDGKVDAADYVLWRKNPAAHGGDPAGFNTWRANFGTGSGAGSGLGGGAVPEPRVCVVLAVTTVLGLFARFRA